MKTLIIVVAVVLALFIGWKWFSFSFDAEALRLGIAGLEMDSYTDNAEGHASAIALRIKEEAARNGFQVDELAVSRGPSFQAVLRFVKGADGKPITDVVHDYTVALAVSKTVLFGLRRGAKHSIQFRRVCKGDHDDASRDGSEQWP